MVNEVVRGGMRRREKKMRGNRGGGEILEKRMGKVWKRKVGGELGGRGKVKREGKMIKGGSRGMMVLVIGVISAV